MCVLVLHAHVFVRVYECYNVSLLALFKVNLLTAANEQGPLMVYRKDVKRYRGDGAVDFMHGQCVYMGKLMERAR